MKLIIRMVVISSLISLLFLEGCSRTPTPDFQRMTLPRSPNYYLVCPQNYCNVTPNEISPVYPVSAEDLFAAFNQVIAQQSDTNFVYNIPEQGLYLLESHAYIFNFPDDIAVQFVALPNNQSTLVLYGKSRYFYYDFGVNKKRINKWLQQLNQTVATIAATPSVSSNGLTTETPSSADTQTAAQSSSP